MDNYIVRAILLFLMFFIVGYLSAYLIIYHNILFKKLIKNIKISQFKKKLFETFLHLIYFSIILLEFSVVAYFLKTSIPILKEQLGEGIDYRFFLICSGFFFSIAIPFILLRKKLKESHSSGTV